MMNDDGRFCEEDLLNAPGQRVYKCVGFGESLFVGEGIDDKQNDT
jgi:hypothetical protein